MTDELKFLETAIRYVKKIENLLLDGGYPYLALRAREARIAIAKERTAALRKVAARKAAPKR